jgi:group II intron reverse transcriptase/maturase
VARQRCWRYDWVLDLDIKSFFDDIDRELLMRAVRKHTDCPWVLLYLERWLRAPVQMADGSLIGRERGTPQGGVVTPLLANLFLHYAFDMWMRRNHPAVPFERGACARAGRRPDPWADDAICHCRSEAQARALRASLERRFVECRLTLHPEKTKIVYCKDDDRRGDYPDQKFDFLGYTFRPRLSRRRRGSFGVSFSRAASDKALKAIRQTIRSWSLHERSDKSLDDLARMFNSPIRGWINYYGPVLQIGALPDPATHRPDPGSVGASEVQVLTTAPTALTAMARPHRATTATPVCPLGPSSRARLDNGSRMRREPHVRFCERAVVRFRGATHLPYWDNTYGNPQLIVPYTLDANDMRFATAQGFNSGDQFFAYLTDTFDVLYREGESSPRMMSVGLHCRLAGRPGHTAALERFLDYAVAHQRVWITRRIDIARHWVATHPFAG